MKIAWLAVTGPDSLVRPHWIAWKSLPTLFSPSAPPRKQRFPLCWPSATPFARNSSPASAKIAPNCNPSFAPNPPANSSTPTPAGTRSSRYSSISSAHSSDEDLAIHLLRHHHVHVHPGHFYDFPSNGHLVISLITPPSDFRAGVQALLKSLE